GTRIRLDRVLELLGEVCAVGQPGEAVVRRHALDALFGEHAVGDVAADAPVAGEAAGLVGRRLPADRVPGDPLVAIPAEHLDVTDRLAAPHRVGDRPPRAAARHAQSHLPGVPAQRGAFRLAAREVAARAADAREAQLG